MSAGVLNLDNLREITGGDRDLEKELFGVFVESSDECLAALKSSCTPETSEEWRKQAHAWKGISLNLGADSLGALCKTAQDQPAMTTEEKAAILKAMEEEYEAVKKMIAAIP